MRDKSGRFVKGYSGNAGGRPKVEQNIAEVGAPVEATAVPRVSSITPTPKKTPGINIYKQALPYSDLK